MGMTELSKRIGLNRSTVYRLVSARMESGFIRQGSRYPEIFAEAQDSRAGGIYSSEICDVEAKPCPSKVISCGHYDDACLVGASLIGDGDVTFSFPGFYVPVRKGPLSMSGYVPGSRDEYEYVLVVLNGYGFPGFWSNRSALWWSVADFSSLWRSRFPHLPGLAVQCL